MKIKIGICDDDSRQRTNLKSMASSWALQHGYEVLFREYLSAETFLFRYSEDGAFATKILIPQI